MKKNVYYHTKYIFNTDLRLKNSNVYLITKRKEKKKNGLLLKKRIKSLSGFKITHLARININHSIAKTKIAVRSALK